MALDLSRSVGRYVWAIAEEADLRWPASAADVQPFMETMVALLNKARTPDGEQCEVWLPGGSKADGLYNVKHLARHFYLALELSGVGSSYVRTYARALRASARDCAFASGRRPNARTCGRACVNGG